MRGWEVGGSGGGGGRGRRAAAGDSPPAGRVVGAGLGAVGPAGAVPVLSTGPLLYLISLRYR